LRTFRTFLLPGDSPPTPRSLSIPTRRDAFQLRP
jgi:hypothetical protein